MLVRIENNIMEITKATPPQNIEYNKEGKAYVILFSHQVNTVLTTEHHD